MWKGKLSRVKVSVHSSHSKRNQTNKIFPCLPLPENSNLDICINRVTFSWLICMAAQMPLPKPSLKKVSFKYNLPQMCSMFSMMVTARVEVDPSMRTLQIKWMHYIGFNSSTKKKGRVLKAISMATVACKYTASVSIRPRNKSDACWTHVGLDRGCLKERDCCCKMLESASLWWDVLEVNVSERRVSNRVR